eukprot:scaffold81589_cov18-Tisochrysis_lutea.AAC.1
MSSPSQIDSAEPSQRWVFKCAPLLACARVRVLLVHAGVGGVGQGTAAGGSCRPEDLHQSMAEALWLG